MKFDDASWHYNGEFPKDLPDQAGATHTGMFLAWALLNGLAGKIYREDMDNELGKLKRREVTPGQFFFNHCDGKFTNEDLSEEGVAFAKAYFDFETGEYLTDYEDHVAGDLDSLYRVPDTWENYDCLDPVIRKRYDDWLAKP